MKTVKVDASEQGNRVSSYLEVLLQQYLLFC